MFTPPEILNTCPGAQNVTKRSMQNAIMRVTFEEA